MLLHAFTIECHSSNLMSLQVNWASWAGQCLPGSQDLELAAIIASDVTRPIEGTGLRALYLAKRVEC